MLKRGYTLVEIMVTLGVLALIVAIVAVNYSASRKDAARVITQSSIRHGSEVLETHFTRKSDYPPNLAGTEFVPSDKVVTVLYTNAPQVRQHVNLTSDQNAQLFLNSCNANMPVVDGSTTYNTSCSFAGQNVHIKGKKSSNIVLHGPILQEADIELTCGSACDAALALMKAEFIAQGGTWPLSIPTKQVTLPEPVLVTGGNASRYCLEGRYDEYTDVISHISSGDSVPSEGPCPSDPELHYP